MGGFAFLIIIILVVVIVYLVKAVEKINSVSTKLNLLSFKIDSIEEGIRKLNVQFNYRPATVVDSTQEQQSEVASVSVTEKLAQKEVVSEQVHEERLIQKEIIKETIVDEDLSIAVADVVDRAVAIEKSVVFTQEPEVVLPTALDEIPKLQKEEGFTPTVSEFKSNNVAVEVLGNRPVKKSAIELFFSENLLTKIGVITFVLGIGFFVKYAIDQEWINEVGRVGIGILTGGIMIGIAHRLRTDLNVFSSLLVGGGISVFYITITLAFREYELFNQSVAFIILILITCLSVAFSLLYDRKELAIFSLLGGFMAPLMVSTGTGNYLVLFSYIFILNSGMLYLSFKRNWIIIGYIAFVLTAIFKAVWVDRVFVDQYLGASIFSILFFVQFYLVALTNVNKNKDNALQIVLTIINNMVFLGLFLALFNNYGTVNLKGLIVMAFALMNLLVLLYLRKKQHSDSLYLYTILGIVMSLVTMAIPLQLNGYYITIFWAVEMVVLLLLHIKSKVKIFYTGFVIVAVLALFSYFMDTILMDKMEYATLIFNKLFISGLVVFTSLFVVDKILKRNNIETLEMQVLPYVIRVVGFVVPLVELNKELQFITESYPLGVFESIAFIVYSLIYAAVLSLISTKNKVNYIIYGILLSFSTLVIWSVFPRFRAEVFVNNHLNISFFLVTFLTIPALITLIVRLYTNKAYKESPTVVRWVLPVIVLVLLCLFIDDTMVLLRGKSIPMSSEVYRELLRSTHIVVYPIVWGTIALVMTFLGIKKVLVFARQIAIALLGLTIVKFYVLDVWSMSEGGKVLSFVLLGLIILLVSFLLNKIKGLLVEAEKQTVENIKNSLNNERE